MKHKREQQVRSKGQKERNEQQKQRQLRLLNSSTTDIPQICQNCYHQRNHPSMCFARQPYGVPVGKKSTCDRWRFR